MADYFTNFSLVIFLPNETAQTYALGLAHQADQVQQGEECPKDFPSSLLPVLEDWSFETELENSGRQCGLWLHSASGGIEAVCAFIQHLLQKFDFQAQVTFEWSHDCSKPRVDAYGGGAAIITAHKIKTISTGEWLAKNAA